MKFYISSKTKCRLQNIVSIPNGMKFYANSPRSLSAMFCFNSQRDEILQGRNVLERAMLELFQFPTGWNSTEIVDGFHRYTTMRFNSQRDEILPMAVCRPASAKTFQFPTGWNSTNRYFSSSEKPKVSIPNGMKFYFMFSTRKLPI